MAEISGIRCECYGSLAATGHGHGTDTAIMLGLWGKNPIRWSRAAFPEKSPACTSRNVVRHGRKNVRFSPSRDLDLSHYQPLRLHRTGCSSLPSTRTETRWKTRYFIPRGRVRLFRTGTLHPEERDRETFPFPYESAEELLHMADERGCPLSSIVMANECAMLPERKSVKNWT
ncbi:MAG: serine dehydratase beta chain [Akkermansia sp.]